MNLQPIEKAEMSPLGTLQVHSVFYTIQGEGPFCGQPAIFIRLAGCNLQCPGCDTDYTSLRATMTAGALWAKVQQLCEDEYPDAPKPLIVITGGEPFRQNISPICKTLLADGFRIQIETNGTLPPSPNLPGEVTIVCSPKTGKINEQIADRISALKYIVKSQSVLMSDGLPTRSLEHTCSPCVYRPAENFKGTVYVQPMDEGVASLNRRNLTEAMDSCMKHGHTLQVQLHKVIGVE